MLISVVIPTHNRRAAVAEAVQSVVEQRDCPAPEIVVIDDGSTDQTAAALRQRFGSRVRVVSTANRGVAAARNLGVTEARGDWLAFLDSDDLWLPNKLPAQLALLATRPDAEICQTEEIWLRDAVRINIPAHLRKPCGDIFAASLERCAIGPSSVLLQRRLFERAGGFDESLPACEDYDLWLRITRSTPVWLVDQPLTVKRAGHADQLSRRYWGMDRFRVAALLRLLTENDLSAAQQQAVVETIRVKCGILAEGARKRGTSDLADNYLRLAAWAVDRPTTGPAAIRQAAAA